MNNPEARTQSEPGASSLPDRLEYHRETKELCPKCGTRLLADDVGGLFLKCSKCSWTGDHTLLMFLDRVKTLKRLFLDEEYRQRFDQAKTWPEIDSVLKEFLMNEQKSKKKE